MKTRTVKPCGMLYSGMDVWHLIHPYPVVKDSWQDDRTHRFVCVPTIPVNYDDNVNNPVYPYARHVVTNSFAIEYRADMEAIEIEVLEEVDVTETELRDVSNEEVANILQENDYGI